MKNFRIRLIMIIARFLSVPIDVHQTFFVKGIKSKMS
jgi:hypothetical protein